MHILDVTIKNVSDFYQVFGVAIASSLIGAVIGHFKSNGYIQMPTVIIDYKKSQFFKNGFPKWVLPIALIIWTMEFLLFLIGLRFKDNKEKGAIGIELGFIGDLLVGVGAGILAKTTLSLAGASNTYSVISTSLLAGFGGLSYIQAQQAKSLDRQTGSYTEKYKSAEIDTEYIPPVNSGFQESKAAQESSA